MTLVTPRHFWYIWEKYRSCEITSDVISKINLPLYKGLRLKITNKWWPLTTLNRRPLYRIKIYSKMHREITKVTVTSRWPLYKGDRYDRFDCTCLKAKFRKFFYSFKQSLSQFSLVQIQFICPGLRASGLAQRLK